MSGCCICPSFLSCPVMSDSSDLPATPWFYQNIRSRRNSGLDGHAEAEHPQEIADNYYDSSPVSTECRATYDGDAIYNYPPYHLSYSGQPLNGPTESPLHQEITQRTLGSSTTWELLCGVHPSDPSAYYAPAPDSSPSGACPADTPSTAHLQSSNHNAHYQALGGPYSRAGDRLEPDAPHLVDSSTAHTQPAHHDTHRQSQSLEGLYAGRVANDRPESYMPYPADFSPIAHPRPIHYGTHRQIQSPGGTDFRRVVGGGFAPHAADSSFIVHAVSTLPLRHPPPDLSPGVPEFGRGVVDDEFTPYAQHSADSLIEHTQPIDYDAHRQIQSPGGPDLERVVDNGLPFYTPHPVDPSPIRHTQPVHYGVHSQIQSSGWPYFSHTANEEFELDVHPANPPPITPTQPAYHDIFQLPEEPHFGPRVDNEFEPDLHPANPQFITPTQLHRDTPQLPEEPSFGPRVNERFELDFHPANPPLITPTQLHRDIFQLPEEPHFGPGVDYESEPDLHPATYHAFSRDSSAYSIPRSPQNNNVPSGTINDNGLEYREDVRRSACEWNDGDGPCGEDIIVDWKSIKKHVTSRHLNSRLPINHPTQCRWENCKLKKCIRRDTTARHVCARHFDIKRPKY